MDTPLIALRMLLGKKATVQYLPFGLNLVVGCALAIARCNSERNADARRFLREAHEKPHQLLGKSAVCVLQFRSKDDLWREDSVDFVRKAGKLACVGQRGRQWCGSPASHVLLTVHCIAGVLCLRSQRPGNSTRACGGSKICRPQRLGMAGFQKRPTQLGLLENVIGLHKVKNQIMDHLVSELPSHLARAF